MTSNLTFDRYCHTSLFLFSFSHFLSSFIDNLPFRLKLWIKGYYFWHISIDLWPYTLTFDPDNESDLFVFICLLLLPNSITIVHFILKFCMKMYIFRKIALTFDLYIWPFTLVDMSVYLTTYIEPFHQPTLWLDLQSQSYVQNNIFQNHIFSDRVQKHNLAS